MSVLARPFAPRLRVPIVVALALGLLFASLGALRSASAQESTPPSVTSAASVDAADRIGVDPDQIVLHRAEAVTWPDGCLGAAEPGEFCTEALVDGFVLWVGTNDVAHRYHTDAADAVRFAAGPIATGDVETAPLPAGAAPRTGRFAEELPIEGGVALVTWTGGQVQDLDDAAPHAISFWVTVDGRFHGYIPAAPPFVNAQFLALFPDGAIPANTLMLVALPRATDFNETGNAVRDTPGLPPGVWHLVYEAPGAPALTVELLFMANSQCVFADDSAFSCGELETGMRVRVEGRLLSENRVQVHALRVEQAAPIPAQVYFLDEPRYVAGTPPFVVAVERSVTPPAVASGALDALFAGPTDDEHASGLRLIRSGAMGATVMRLEDGVAHVRLVGGCDSAGATFTIANHIRPTLAQFAAIDWVKIYDPEGMTGQPTGLTDSIPECLEP